MGGCDQDVLCKRPWRSWRRAGRGVQHVAQQGEFGNACERKVFAVNRVMVIIITLHVLMLFITVIIDNNI
eukprot:10673383-Lingulodinium_polyedra.AAC.1